jgi:hypothetical protein
MVGWKAPLTSTQSRPAAFSYKLLFAESYRRELDGKSPMDLPSILRVMHVYGVTGGGFETA